MTHLECAVPKKKNTPGQHGGFIISTQRRSSGSTVEAQQESRLRWKSPPTPHPIPSERNLSTSTLANGIRKSCHEDMKTMMKSLGQESGAVFSEAMLPAPGRANNFHLLHCSMRTWGQR